MGYPSCCEVGVYYTREPNDLLANHLANTYALEYMFGAMLDKTQKQLQTADKTLTDQQAVAQNHRLFLCHLIHAYLYFMHRPTKKWKG